MFGISGYNGLERFISFVCISVYERIIAIACAHLKLFVSRGRTHPTSYTTIWQIGPQRRHFSATREGVHFHSRAAGGASLSLFWATRRLVVPAEKDHSSVCM